MMVLLLRSLTISAISISIRIRVSTWVTLFEHQALSPKRMKEELIPILERFVTHPYPYSKGRLVQIKDHGSLGILAGFGLGQDERKLLWHSVWRTFSMWLLMQRSIDDVFDWGTTGIQQKSGFSPSFMRLWPWPYSPTNVVCQNWISSLHLWVSRR